MGGPQFLPQCGKELPKNNAFTHYILAARSSWMMESDPELHARRPQPLRTLPVTAIRFAGIGHHCVHAA
jgi:hypothetical protein